ncbi:hypothetical protein ASF04_20255 [Duganella sp. Leaf61]|uniref:DUF4124 domain-containing protein n=1 Tax=Duganella sp. Leaf61 TaxID=1736227 RepID=UPI0006F63168|nr:DUF4124 domain-containing protein [Duganella sp. Leaf61]KQN65241.1 hypothetical protein ASF04_20255 [Duganella sp. Leaf61]
MQPHLYGPVGVMTTALLCATTLHTVHAQDIHKCIVDGKVSYGDTPCPATATSASTLARPAAPQVDPAAAASLARARKEAAALEKTRVARDEHEAKLDARAAQVAATHERKCGKLRLNRQWADDDARRATAATVDAARLKARRAAELLALECAR